jgi:excinuclease ABC subunit A
MTKDLAKLSSKTHILIKGAQMHNLKGIDVAIPRNKLVVITGLSGSGKSSLAFDTLYAEGQRRYVESLSSYARQFLGKLHKPKVDYIKGISPAIAIEQKVNTSNARSTVGTSTEIYDYIKLLYARIGKTYSPISGKEVKKHQISDVSNYVKTFKEGTKLLLLAPISIDDGRKLETTLKVLSQQGYSRVLINGIAQRISEVTKFSSKDNYIIIQRIVTQNSEDFYHRLHDAIQLAFFEGKGTCIIQELDSQKNKHFSNKFELDDILFNEPNVHLFSFNNPYGACPTCNGYGNVIGIDENLVIPNTALSLYENCILPWRTDKYDSYKQPLFTHAEKYGISIHKPWYQLTDKQKELIWKGTKHFEGLNKFFKKLEAKSYKIQNRVMLSRYRGKTKCHTCYGKRLKQEAEYVKISGKSITELVDIPIEELAQFFKDLQLNKHEKSISKRLLIEINTRIAFLVDVGLGYLTLNRNSNTLSGGESQRINLATSLGSSLVGSMYILDEPSIGLHSKDTERLIKVLKNLRDLGNTVIVVEHDEDIMKTADYIIDIGPEAGSFGGEIVAEGNFKNILKSDTLTAKYLNGSIKIPIPKLRRTSSDFIKIKGAREHNLKNIDVQFPLHCLSIVTGVSGSGKSTLVRNILYPAIQKHIGGYGDKLGQFTALEGSLNSIQNIEFINQNPIGRSSRSNPVTYIKAYDDIRALFADEKLSKIRNYTPKYFSFNVEGGRCDVCKGEGEVTIEMQFMADVHLECETCHGKRFKKEVLEVKYHNKSISDILDLTVEEAIAFFDLHQQKKIVQKLKPLEDVGLGYVHLGQASSTLSGGEAQRIKLASFLVKGNNTAKTLFIFDEPTTGLHFHDIKKLLDSFNALIENGHTVIVIEHNLELIKAADYIVDLGKDGGIKGGNLIFQGTPEELVKSKTSYTATYLKEKLKT